MSREWVALRQQSIGSEIRSPDAVIAELAATRPALAQRLGGIDWDAVVHQVATNALAAVAAKLGINHLTAFENHDGYERGSSAPANTVVVGALRRGDDRFAQLGLARKGTSLVFFSNGRGEQLNGAELDRWREELRVAYRVESVDAAVRVMGGQTTRTTEADGTVRIETRGAR